MADAAACDHGLPVDLVGAPDTDRQDARRPQVARGRDRRREALPRQLPERVKAPQLAARPPVDLAELAVEHEGLGDGHDENVRRYVPRLVGDDGDLHAAAPGGHQ